LWNQFGAIVPLCGSACNVRARQREFVNIKQSQAPHSGALAWLSGAGIMSGGKSKTALKALKAFWNYRFTV
jgi:hypothetical protein